MILFLLFVFIHILIKKLYSVASLLVSFALHLTIITLCLHKTLSSKMEETDDDANRETSAKERGLWDVLVNNDDITFTNILPRLNQTDIKQILVRGE